jgi:hypothetical protein
MDLLAQTAALLKRFGYDIVSSDMPGRRFLKFEDDSLLGFVWVDNVGAIIETWEAVQDQFLRENASTLRKSPTKTWNLYMVCLSGARGNAEQQTALASLQEDFRGARKIAHSGVASEAQLIRALYPLIPVQNVVSLEAEDPVSRVRERLQQLPAEAVTPLVSPDLELNEALEGFLDAHEIEAN